MSKYKVIIPGYEEEKVISRVIKSIPKNFDVIFVDDGSKDRTAEEAKKSGACVVRHFLNLGQGGAIETGIKYALKDSSAAYFATFDADGQHSVTDLKTMFNELKSSKVDIVLGSRFLKNKGKVPLTKIITLKIALLITKLSTGLRLSDTHNGLRVFNRDVAEKIEFTNFGMVHASEFYEIIKENKFKYKEFPTKITYNNYTKAKGQPIINSVNILFDMLFKGK